jgi:amino acid adenylation domain-containing protein/non-ribosomal peptide synthase protein (TIGR01720 family)
MALSREERIAALPAHLQAAFAQRAAGTTGAAPSAPALPPLRAVPEEERPAVLPAAPTQERLWFAHRSEPTDIQYNAPLILRVRGPLDRHRLESALRELVQIHPSLRTRFAPVEQGRMDTGTPGRVSVQQIIGEPGEMQIPWREAGPGESVESIAAEEVSTPFDLERGTVFRPSVVALADEDHLLILGMHHIIADGWSTGVIRRDLEALYRGERVDPPALDVVDYALWQEQKAHSPAREADLAWWADRLRGVPQLDLPTRRPRSDVRTTGGGAVRRALDPAVAQRFAEACQTQRSTPFMGVLAAAFVLFSKLSGQRDFAVSTVSFGRGSQELERVVGFFANTIALRSPLEGAQTFLDVLAGVREEALEGFRRDDVPFQSVVEAVNPHRDPAVPPLAQVMVNMAAEQSSPGSAGGLTAEAVTLESTATDLDLIIDCTPSAAGMTLSVEYSTDLFDREDAELLAERLERVIAQAAERPDVPIDEISLLSRGEAEDLAHRWNATDAPLPAPEGLHEAFFRQVAAHPGAVAVEGVTWRGEPLSWTYGDLADRSLAVATDLLRRGLSLEEPVALVLDRTPDALAAVLGVWAAGGMAVPLGRDDAPERRRRILEISGARIILDSRDLPDSQTLPSGGAKRDPRPASDPTRAAYALFTSGSTGTPKGVVVEHGSAHATLSAWSLRYGFDAEPPRVLSVSAPTVDLFMGDLLMALSFGGSMIMASSGDLEDPAALRRLVLEGKPTVLATVPGLARALVEELGGEGVRAPSLRLVAVGSEGWRADEARALLRVLPASCRLVNAYGVTEAAIDSTVWDITPNSLESVTGFLPLGGPLPGVHAHVLDAALRPVPVGVTGELCLSGQQIARGYLGDPDLTSARFLEDPLTAGGDARRMYRTGDLVRRRADGIIEFIGRSDDQIKIRGFRVELGQVEHALAGVPGVIEAVAALDTSRPESPRLRGFVRGGGKEPAPPLTEEAVLGAVRGELPAYAVPATITVVDGDFPRLASGKADRRALLERLPAAVEARVAPTSLTEMLLRETWAEVLRRNPAEVGIEDNFFDLGGDSIMSLQVVTRAKRRGLEMSSRDLFAAQTISALADVVDSRTERPAAHGAERQADGERDVPLLPIQWDLLAGGGGDPRSAHQSLALVVETNVDERALGRALAVVVDQHDALRTVLPGGLTEPRQNILPPGAFGPEELLAVTDAREQGERGSEVERDILERSLRDFPLVEGPLFRADLIRSVVEGSERAVLALAVHHWVIDAVSWRTVLDDLETAYRQISVGEPPVLDARTTTAAAWGRALIEHTLSGGFDAEIPLWAGICGAVPPRAELGASADREDAAQGLTVELELDERTTARVLRAAAASPGTVQDFVLAAFREAYCAAHGLDEVAVLMESHGREEQLDAPWPTGVDLSRTVGWFTAVYPLLLRRSGTSEIVAEVAEQTAAVPHRGLGYGALRHLRRTPGIAEAHEPSISFNYLGVFDTRADSADGLILGRAELPEVSQPSGFALDVTVGVHDGRLLVRWQASGSVETPAADAAARAFTETLRAWSTDVSALVCGENTPEETAALLAGLSDVEDLYELTPMQEGMLFHSVDSRSGDAGSDSDLGDVYMSVLDLTLTGVHSPDALAEAWRAVARLTPALRTTFHWQDLHTPVQVIHADAVLPVDVQDLRGASPEEIDAAARSARAACETAADLSRGPLASVAILQLDDSTVRVLWGCHHLLIDGWSFAHLLGDVLQEYSAKGSVRPRPEVRSFVRSLRDRDFEGDRAYWAERLEGFGDPTPVPCAERAATGLGARSSEALTAALSAEATALLVERARACRVTPSVIFQAAWARLLSLASGDADVLFATTVSGRTADLPGLEDMVGLFINTLPVRISVTEAPASPEWLQGIQEQQLASEGHAQVPLPEVFAAASRPPGETLLTTLAVFENFPLSSLDSAGDAPTIAAVDGQEDTSFALSATAVMGEEMTVRLSFDPEAVVLESAQWILETLVTILSTWAESDDAFAARSIVPPEISAQYAELGRRVPSSQPAETVGGLFAQAAARAPESVALIQGAAQWTFAELDAAAAALEGALSEQGVGSESRVAVLAERSPSIVALLLALSRLGAVWVPLHTTVPPARAARMLDSVGAAAVVVPVGSQELVREACALADGAWTSAALGDDLLIVSGPGEGKGPEGAAYIMHTSGSTGTPKGVVITQETLASFVQDPLLTPSGEGDASRTVTLVHSPLAFDAGNFELWHPLLTGGTAVLLEGDMTPQGLRAAVRSHGVRRTFITTSLLAVLVDEDVACFAGLEEVWTGGEAANPRILTALRKAHPSLEIVHVYGPTETTTFAALRRFGPGEAIPDPVPLGTPLHDLGAVVVDALLQPVPPGSVGDLLLEGPRLARGYLGQPELTAERFVPSRSGSGERQYRTGDRALWTPDGELVFAGRADEELKLRGFRIDPGDVAAELRACPGAADVLVRLHEARELVAYALPDTAEDSGAQHLAAPRLTAETLLIWARRVLPAYAVPDRIVLLSAWPVTANGKTDVAALESLTLESQATEASPADRNRAPEGRWERLTAEIWEGVLGREAGSLTANADFFALGGNSLDALRASSRASTAVEAAVGPRALFDAPRLADFARWLAEHAGPTASNTDHSASASAAAPRDSEHTPTPVEAPLTPAQQRLWFHETLTPGSSEYNTVLALSRPGGFDPDPVLTAMAEVTARHDALRTVVAQSPEGPLQRVLSPEEMPDLPLDTAVAQDEGEFVRLVEDVQRQAFDLASGPLLRLRIIDRAPGADGCLVVVIHHLVTDGWSTGIIARDFARAYARAVGEESEPEEERRPRSFLEAVAAIDPPENDDVEAAWIEALTGWEQLTLPIDRPRPPVRQAEGREIRVVFSREDSEALRRRAREAHAGLYPVLVAMTALMLSRFCRQGDVIVGTALAGRDSAEAEETVGYFVDTAVVPVRCREEGGFSDLIGEARSALLFALEHRIPFDRLIHVLDVERDPQRNPLVDVMVTLENTPFGALEAGIAPAEVPALQTEVSDDLAFDFTETAEGRIECRVGYAAALFDESTVAQMIAHLELLASQLRADEANDTPLHDLPLLSEGDRRDRISELPAPYDDADLQPLVPETLLRRAAEHPDLPAVAGPGSRLSFGELSAETQALAASLHASGVGPGDVVALWVSRGTASVVSMLGVLCSGAAFMPLDESVPPALRRWMVEDSGARLLITDAATRRRAEEDSMGSVELRDLDELVSDGRASSAPAAMMIQPDDRAYIMYTSGSTGRPKGVVVEHRSLSHLARLWNEYYGLEGSRPRALCVSGFTVDLFIGDLLWSTLWGGEMVVCGEDDTANAQRIVELIESEDVDLLVTVPSLARVMGQALAARGRPLERLRVLAVGSEGWRSSDCRELLKHIGSETRVVNAYGATENTVDAILCDVRAEGDDAAVGPFVAIGRPAPGTPVYVVDGHRRLVPDGVPGQMLIGGRGVAREYANRPAESAEAFLEDDWGRGQSGSRVYATSDLVRRSGSGLFHFLGRTDDMVKIRGHRVELGQVEAALSSVDGVLASAAAVRPGQAGDPVLFGYVTLRPGSTLTGEEIRAAASALLPRHALPAAVAVLDEMPLNRSGKTDRHRLPELSLEGTGEIVEPRTSQEHAVRQLFSSVLGLPVEKIGAQSNFFDLGGESILSIQLVFAAREAGYALEPRDVIIRQTVEGIAQVLADRQAADTSGADSRGASGDSSRDRWIPGSVFPWTPVQKQLMDAGDPMEPAPTAREQYRQSGLFQIASTVSAAELAAALTAVREAHPMLGLVVEHTAEGYVQRIPESLPDLSVWHVDLTGLEGAVDDPVSPLMAHADRLARAVDRDSRWTDGPLSVLWLDTDAGPLVYLSLHHLVVDTVSWGILLEDLELAHRALRGEDSAGLPRESAPFPLWAQRLAAAAEDESFEHERAHWAGSRALVPLPPLGDVSRGTGDLSSILETTGDLTPSETQALLAGSLRSLRMRVGDVLLSAFAWALHRWGGVEHLDVDVESHGREDVFEDLDVSRSVGWFTTIYPVRFAFGTEDDAEPAWSDILRSARTAVRRTPSGGVGFGVLSLLQAPRPGADVVDPSPSSALFNYHGSAGGHGAGGGQPQEGALLTRRLGAVGEPMHPDHAPSHAVEMIAAEDEGVLRWELRGDSARVSPESLERLSGLVGRALRGMTGILTERSGS